MGQRRIKKGAPREGPPLAIGYVRVSTGKQATEGHSLAAQQQAIIDFCARSGLELAGMFMEEAESAKTPLAGRPEGARLLAEIAKGKVLHLVTYSMTRLFRNMLDCLQHLERFDKQHIVLHFIDKNIRTDGPVGRGMLYLLGMVAEMEREQIAERTAFVAQNRRRQGKKYTGSRPYGFQFDGDNLVADQREQRLLTIFRRIQERYNVAYNTMAVKANRRGIPGPRGGTWSRQTMQRIITDPERIRTDPERIRAARTVEEARL